MRKRSVITNNSGQHHWRKRGRYKWRIDLISNEIMTINNRYIESILGI